MTAPQRITKELQELIFETCHNRGLTFSEMKKAETRKAARLREVVIFTIRKSGLDISEIAEYLDMTFAEVLSVLRDGEPYVPKKSEIQSVMNEDIYHPSRRRGLVR